MVDEDIDPTKTFDVLWALATRSDPVDSIDILRRCWSGPLDPRIEPGKKGFNSRAIIDATRPFEWKDQFPAVSQIDKETHDSVAGKWKDELDRVVRGHQ